MALACSPQRNITGMQQRSSSDDEGWMAEFDASDDGSNDGSIQIDTNRVFKPTGQPVRRPSDRMDRIDQQRGSRSERNLENTETGRSSGLYDSYRDQMRGSQSSESQLGGGRKSFPSSASRRRAYTADRQENLIRESNPEGGNGNGNGRGSALHRSMTSESDPRASHRRSSASERDYDQCLDEGSVFSSGGDLARRCLMQQQKGARRRQSKQLDEDAGDARPSLGDFLSKNRGDDSDEAAASGSNEDEDDATFFSMFQWSTTGENQQQAKKKTYSSSRSVGGRSMGGAPSSRSNSQPRATLRSSASVMEPPTSTKSQSLYEKQPARTTLLRHATAPNLKGFQSCPEDDEVLERSSLRRQGSRRSGHGALEKEVSDRFDSFLREVRDKEDADRRRSKSSHRKASSRHNKSDRDPDRDRRKKKKKKDRSERSERDGERRRSSRRSGEAKDVPRGKSRSSRLKSEGEGLSESKRRSRRHKSGAATADEDRERHRRASSKHRPSSSRRRSSRKLEDQPSKDTEGTSRRRSPRTQEKEDVEQPSVAPIQDSGMTGDESQYESQHESQSDTQFDSDYSAPKGLLGKMSKCHDANADSIIIQFDPTKAGNIDQVVTSQGALLEINHFDGTRSVGRISEMPETPDRQANFLSDSVTASLTMSFDSFLSRSPSSSGLGGVRNLLKAKFGRKSKSASEDDLFDVRSQYGPTALQRSRSVGRERAVSEVVCKRSKSSGRAARRSGVDENHDVKAKPTTY
jgi:hypothetical protein